MDKRKNTKFDKTIIRGSIKNDKVLNEFNMQHTNVPSSNDSYVKEQRVRRSSPHKKNHLHTNRRFDPFENETYYASSKSRSKVSYTLFYILTVLIALMACIFIFIYAFKTVLSTSVPNPFNKNEFSQPLDNSNIGFSDDKTVIDPDLIAITGFITSYDPIERVITVLDVDSLNSKTLIVDNTSKLSNEYDKIIVFSELSVGIPVTVYYKQNSLYAHSLQKSKDGFNYYDATGVLVNVNSNTISYRNNTFKYDNNTVVSLGNLQLSDISPADILHLSGYKNNLYFIKLIRGHGTLNFTNVDAVENGTIEINTDTFINLNNVSFVDLPIGTHHIVIKGDNIDTYVNDIFVDGNEPIDFDLLKLPNKNSSLTVKTNVDSKTITINDLVYQLDEPIMLPYGTYVVQLSSQGYDTRTESITIDNEITILDFDLIKLKEEATLIIDTIPTGADVFVDNVKVGVTPFSHKLTIGEHLISILHLGYQDMEQVILFDEPTSYPYLFELQENISNYYD